MNTRLVLDFLTELRENNNLDWMHAHKARYQEARGEMEIFVGALLERLTLFDASLVGIQPALSRLNRDTRFSRDKSPYLPAFRVHLSTGGRAPIPVGYYLSLQPGASFLGGGLFASQFPEATRMVRDAIAQGGLPREGFLQEFDVQGEKLKKVPAGYDKDHLLAEYLKYKSWYLEEPVPDALAADAQALLDLAAGRFQRMKPFNDWLNHALAGFTMPERP